MKRTMVFCGLLLCLAAVAQSQPVIDSAQLMKDVSTLSDNRFQGRLTGSRGSRMAQFYLLSRLKAIGLQPYNGTYEYPFYFMKNGKKIMGTNLYGYIPGKSQQAIVITAHYDHLGTGRPNAEKDSIYNGADDNASGVAALLAIAAYYKTHAPRYTLIFAALDGEEEGLQGAKAFLQRPPIPVARIRQEINMDMVSRSSKNQLYACGTHQFPELKRYVEAAAAGSAIHLLTGHDRPEDGDQDWTKQSDHYEFYLKKIPFLYFGVEDHPDYHQPTDEYIRIDHRFFYQAVRTIAALVDKLDRELPENRFSNLKVM